MPNYCSECQSLMRREFANDGTGDISFECPMCFTTLKGTRDDAHISGDLAKIEDSSDQHSRVVELSPYDRAAVVTLRDCKCGLPYMLRVDVSSNYNFYYTCNCGNIEKGPAAKAPAAAKALAAGKPPPAASGAASSASAAAAASGAASSAGAAAVRPAGGSSKTRG